MVCVMIVHQMEGMMMKYDINGSIRNLEPIAKRDPYGESWFYDKDGKNLTNAQALFELKKQRDMGITTGGEESKEAQDEC